MSYKVLKTIDMTLDKGSIQQAINEIKQFRKQLQETLTELVNELTKQGAQVAKMQVTSMDAVDTGYLENSIYGYYDHGKHVGYVFAPAPYAFYVEYGTGIVGAVNPHPEASERGIQYDQNNHGNKGWWYPSEDGWYLAKDGTKLAWTKGMPARPFMYNTMVWMEEAAETIARTKWDQM